MLQTTWTRKQYKTTGPTRQIQRRTIQDNMLQVNDK